eukprot:TRINITY_DN74550_c0_g1_i1.p1 TRINITY_DN74550_c0_g1~~TRINITY_DN74550_c0_g1_i1.p1  ORF type:complete len:737 (+),score=128.06 TRINITY_DN74550_c0_g1_i1:70-2280(+)
MLSPRPGVPVLVPGGIHVQPVNAAAVSPHAAGAQSVPRGGTPLQGFSPPRAESPQPMMGGGRLQGSSVALGVHHYAASGTASPMMPARSMSGFTGPAPMANAVVGVVPVSPRPVRPGTASPMQPRRQPSEGPLSPGGPPAHPAQLQHMMQQRHTSAQPQEQAWQGSADGKGALPPPPPQPPAQQRQQPSLSPQPPAQRQHSWSPMQAEHGPLQLVPIPSSHPSRKRSSSIEKNGGSPSSRPIAAQLPFKTVVQNGQDAAAAPARASSSPTKIIPNPAGHAASQRHAAPTNGLVTYVARAAEHDRDFVTGAKPTTVRHGPANSYEPPWETASTASLASSPRRLEDVSQGPPTLLEAPAPGRETAVPTVELGSVPPAPADEALPWNAASRDSGEDTASEDLGADPLERLATCVAGGGAARAPVQRIDATVAAMPRATRKTLLLQQPGHQEEDASPSAASLFRPASFGVPESPVHRSAETLEPLQPAEAAGAVERRDQGGDASVATVELGAAVSAADPAQQALLMQESAGELDFHLDALATVVASPAGFPGAAAAPVQRLDEAVAAMPRATRKTLLLHQGVHRDGGGTSAAGGELHRQESFGEPLMTAVANPSQLLKREAEASVAPVREAHGETVAELRAALQRSQHEASTAQASLRRVEGERDDLRRQLRAALTAMSTALGAKLLAAPGGFAKEDDAQAVAAQAVQNLELVDMRVLLSEALRTEARLLEQEHTRLMKP